MARGRERLVRCEKCGRWIRRDKAVFIEKTVFTVPLERKDVAEPEMFKRTFTREVAYCPGCGKHLRIYEKKIQQNIRQQERDERRARFDRPQQRKFRKWTEADVGKPSVTPQPSVPSQPAAPAVEETEVPQESAPAQESS